jgi:N-acetyl-alpha-D-muramate 1-phosphate uridylyltransferase
MRQFPLMVFAAGFGTRMGALTADQPKPLLQVGGRSLIHRALALGQQAGCAPVAVNLHYRGDQLARHLHGHDLHLCWEHDAILETGGGLKQALPQLGQGPVMTLNPDAVWQGPNPLQVLAQGWNDAMAGLLLVAPPSAVHGRAGPADFLMAADGRLTRARGAMQGVVYLGAQILTRGPVLAQPDRAFSLNKVWDVLIAEGRLFGTTYTGAWCDVGTPQGLALARSMAGEGGDV